MSPAGTPRLLEAFWRGGVDTSGRYGGRFEPVGPKSTIGSMDERGATFNLPVRCAALLLSLSACAGPGDAGPARSVAAGPEVMAPGERAPVQTAEPAPAQAASQTGSMGRDAPEGPAVTGEGPVDGSQRAAAVRMAELFRELDGEEAAPLLTAYAETRGPEGAAEILALLDPEPRARLLIALQRERPDSAAEVLSALEDALGRLAPDAATLELEAGEVIDAWHRAAAAGDRDGYLGRMTRDARFLGTDSAERWDMGAFTAYVDEHFRPGRGWTFEPAERALVLSSAGDVAWFDERLQSESYGELRGTGVLERVDGQWRVAHYNMTFTVPNAVAGEVVEVVRRAGE